MQDGRAAFIDTGTSYAVPRLLGALDALGLARDAVDWVIPTHVHLDHAGGAGALMQALPQARLLVHPRGLRHMVDPSALWQGALAVYGPAEMDRSYGRAGAGGGRARQRHARRHDGAAGRPHAGLRRHARPRPPPPLRVGRRHARLVHRRHLRPELPRIRHRARALDPAHRRRRCSSSREVLQASIRRLLAADPACMYLTHFGRVAGRAALGAQLLSLIDELVALGQRLPGTTPDRHEALKRGQLEIFTRSLAAHGCTMEREAIAQLLAMDLELNAQGIAIWLDRGS